MTDWTRSRASLWFRASALVMACLLLPVRETTATTPPMYLVHFEYVAPGDEERGSIDEASEPVLQNAIRDFSYAPDSSVCIAGSYDRTGPAQDRMKKSQILAESVAAYLVAHGIPTGRITTTWKGDTELAIPTAEGVAEPANRWVVIVLGAGSFKPSC